MYDKSLMNTKRNKVLITGGCGFIGSHTATLLLEKGFNLVVIDSNKNSNPNVIDIISHLGIKDKRNSPNGVNFYKGDIRDYKFLNEVFEQEKKIFDHFIHLVIHSMLHILGYAHEDKNDAILMESKEIEFLSKIGVKDPYK